MTAIVFPQWLTECQWPCVKCLLVTSWQRFEEVSVGHSLYPGEPKHDGQISYNGPTMFGHQIVMKGYVVHVNIVKLSCIFKWYE